MSRLRWTSLGTVLLVAVCCIQVVAHRPVAVGESYPSASRALELETIDVSQVAYADLSGGEQLWITFVIEEPGELHVSLGIPVLAALADFRPSMAVLGPSMEPIDLSFSIPPGVGGVHFATTEVPIPEAFHEPFTRTDSWIVLEESVSLTAPGRYYVVAFTAGESPAKLWVAIGKEERFGLRDILRLPAIARDVQAFHEIEHRPLARAWEALLVAAILGGMLSWLVAVTYW
ncbi:MAG: hypothetical protein JSW65_05465 [Candidatus Bipolaricaulota bacterium]|nr:MAG: hypothetical protein JSW65_05465 [Candidatus Bipolaricaulota bacterium]